ncbi:MAG: hypothetical protein GY757_42615 [bacterium]|nr:hypothetical protein [bacterium]
MKKNIVEGIIKKRVRQNREGFTLIDSLFSLILIISALLFMAKVFLFAIKGNQKSFTRLQMSQEMESCKNRLLSKPFLSPELEEGKTIQEKDTFKIASTVHTISPGLKKITLSVSGKYLTRQRCFYKSRYIKEVRHD